MATAQLSNASPHHRTVADEASSVSCQQLTLMVDGIHCASCIHAIESTLKPMDGVKEARVNMSTGRLHLVWDGDAERAEDFVHSVEKLGFKTRPDNDAEDHSNPEEMRMQFLLKCLAVSGFAMGNIMLLSVTLWTTNTATMGIATREMFHWISAAIALPTVLYAGRPFFESAWAVLKEKRTNMDVPISIGLILTCAMSMFETINQGEHAYFDSAVMLLFFLLIGRYLDARARGKARETATKLLNMLSGYANVETEGGIVRKIPIRELVEGMVLRVAAGEKIPTDATIIEGSSEIDTSLITGETLPRLSHKGDHVFGGTINMQAPLRVRVAKASADSLLADIIRLMEKAEQGRARYVRLADRVARLYTPVVHTLGATTFFGWWLGMGAPWQVALLHGATVLIITCPCALALAVPVVQILASSWLMRRGILLKSGDALERLTHVDTVIFDKTGTLTLGTPQCMNAEAVPEELLGLAGSLASHTRHPLAQALAQHLHTAPLPLQDVREHAGLGMEARYQGSIVKLGRASWCGVTSVVAEPKAADSYQELWLAVEGTKPQRFTFADRLREDSADIVRELQTQGLEIHLISGDIASVTHSVAQALHITHVQSGLLPTEKCDAVTALREQGRQPFMVGDGLNDAPALAAASVSMSPSSGVDITQNAADLVFQGNKLLPVLQAWRMAKFSSRLVKENFALTVLYNCLAIPLAMMGYVTPMIAALAMSGSSLVVILNAFRINLIKK